MKPVLRVDEMRAVDAEALQEVVRADPGRAGRDGGGDMGGAHARGHLRPPHRGGGRKGQQRRRRKGGRGPPPPARRPGRRSSTPHDAPSASGRSATVDLVIDAAYGTGFRGAYRAPAVPAGVRVLAVDIPSGVDGDTGEACGEPLRADVTVTFAALKTGLVQGDGALLSGQVVVADIGLDVSGAAMGVIEDADVARLLAPRPRDTYKWRSAVAVVAGSPGMTGAAGLCTRAAYRAGAGMLRLGIPGGRPRRPPRERGRRWRRCPVRGWSSDALRMSERCRALVVGPGLGRTDSTVADVRDVVARAARLHRRGCRRPLRPGHGRRDRCRGARRPRLGDGPHPPRRGVRPPGRRPAGGRPHRRRRQPGAALWCHRPAEGADDGGGRARRRGAAGHRRLTPAGHGGNRRRAVGGDRGLRRPRCGARTSPPPWPPTSTAGPPTSAPPRAWWPGDLPELVGRWLSEIRR